MPTLSGGGMHFVLDGVARAYYIRGVSKAQQGETE